MKIIVGLGNPGNRYKHNRHNIGFRCVEELARRHSISIRKVMCQSETGKGTIEGMDVILVKPRTFVNLSGQAVECLLDKFRIDINDLIVVHDDLDLPTGRLRIRLGGKSGGHRGIRSIIDSLGNESFCRMRIGISRPPLNRDIKSYENDIIDYVLANPGADEEEIFLSAIERACDALECILSQGMEIAMSNYNRASSV